ncbi:hypothetical protein TNCV_4174271 [Trichonephila clavipes]|nr:hypothetical protein TNCV_4174271 [Trichonephila clavipes]
MATLLSICTKKERRTVIRFPEIIHRIEANYGDIYLSWSNIYEWIELLKQGRTFLCDDERSAVHRRQPLRVVVVEDRQWSYHVERSPHQQLRGKTSDTWYTSVAN